MSPDTPNPAPSPVDRSPVDRFRLAVLAFVRREGLLPPGSTVVVGVSGGPDSMALLRVLLDIAGELEIVVRAAHVDHAVRADSADDAKFVRDWADRWGAPLHVVRLADPRPSEAGLRDARYAFLRQTAEAVNAAFVAVGHHADDRLETFLAQLIRGAGPRGLSLPRPRRDDGVVRPLLERNRSEIEAYLGALEIPWRTDPGNADGSNLRSRLRRDVVPLLVRENPSVANAVARTAAMMASVDDLLAREGSAALDRLLLSQTPEELTLAGPRGRPYHPLILSTALREAARRLGLDPAVLGFEPLDRLVRAWTGGGRTAVDPPGGLRFEVDPSVVRVFRRSPVSAEPAEADLAVPGQLDWPGGFPESPGSRVHLTVRRGDPPQDPRTASSATVAWADGDRVEGELRVRSRRPGDRYRPLGAPGSVKIQDLFVDRKIPRPWRDGVPLVADTAGILWVPGGRVADRVQIRPESRNGLRFEVTRAADPDQSSGPAPSVEPDEPKRNGPGSTRGEE